MPVLPAGTYRHHSEGPPKFLCFRTGYYIWHARRKYATIGVIRNFQALSRVMTGPAGRITRRSKPRGSSRVGPGLCGGISRVGSGRVRSFPNLTGRGRVTLTRSDPREVIQPVKSPGSLHSGGTLDGSGAFGKISSSDRSSTPT